MIARDDLKRLRRVVNSAAGGDDYGSNNNAGDDSHNNGDDGGGNNDGVDSNSKEVENDEEMMEICDSICTALQEDAGGFFTAGFHLVSLYLSCLLLQLFMFMFMFILCTAASGCITSLHRVTQH